jgi:hypothetical protein
MVLTQSELPGIKRTENVGELIDYLEGFKYPRPEAVYLDGKDRGIILEALKNNELRS